MKSERERLIAQSAVSAVIGRPPVRLGLSTTV